MGLKTQARRPRNAYAFGVLASLLLAGWLTPAFGAAAPSVPAFRASFDYYVLSLEWHPTFCAGRASLPECQNPDFDRALVMHGLWPSRRGDTSNSFGYCGVDASIRQLDNAQSRFEMPAVPISQETLAQLSARMPGVDACLERHEWYRHGTCSGLDAETYFALADSLVSEAHDSRLGRFIAGHAGQTVSADDAWSEAVADWGGAARDAVAFVCSRGALSEVRVTLSPAARSVAALSPAGMRSTCGASFTIPAR